jgi:hypothetical protein
VRRVHPLLWFQEGNEADGCCCVLFAVWYIDAVVVHVSVSPQLFREGGRGYVLLLLLKALSSAAPGSPLATGAAVFVCDRSVPLLVGAMCALHSLRCPFLSTACVFGRHLCAGV